MIVETRRPRWLLATVLPTLLAIGCTGRSNVGVGGPCARDESCITDVCLHEVRQEGQSLWQGGYCSGNCQKEECPSGSCLHLEDGLSYCVSSCTANSDCREGYRCVSTTPTDKACLPDCRLGWSCGSTLTCNDETGTCDVPPGTPGPIGDPCTWNAECTSGLCTPEQGTSGPTYWTGGSCTQQCSATVECPSGASCVPFESAGSYCVAWCEAVDGCRPGYVCATDVHGCLPDCSQGWSCGTALTCNDLTGLCVPPSANVPDAGADASSSRDLRPDDAAGGTSDAMGDGKGGAGGPGPGGPTWAATYATEGAAR
jgi:hypothetical protein